MAKIIGTDEAGYGPNLGPLVVTATSWTIPSDPRQFDFWTVLQDVVSQKNETGKLQVADSKQVYSPSKGIVSLERNILPILRTCFGEVNSFRDLTQHLIRGNQSKAKSQAEENSEAAPVDDQVNQPLVAHPFDIEPWYEDADIKLPLATESGVVEESTDRLKRAFDDSAIHLEGIHSDIVLTERFNAICESNGTKGAALSRSTFGLIRSFWDPDTQDPTFVIGDKHGGRNRYLDLIYEQLDGQWASIISEGREQSNYSVGKTRLTFRTGAESHFPVAVASMVCKYVRELSMELFNEFWQSHVSDLKPTKGYPQDARRFRADIAQAQSVLGISDQVLWRER
jgi:hypothetical protein